MPPNISQADGEVVSRRQFLTQLEKLSRNETGTFDTASYLMQRVRWSDVEEQQPQIPTEAQLRLMMSRVMQRLHRPSNALSSATQDRKRVRLTDRFSRE